MDGIIVINASGDVEIYNAACERLFGYNAAEVIGRNVKMLMPSPYQREHDGYLSNYKHTGRKRIIVLEQLVIGRSNKVAAYELGISPRTIEIHRARIMDKMNARSLSDLVRVSLAAGRMEGSA